MTVSGRASILPPMPNPTKPKPRASREPPFYEAHPILTFIGGLWAFGAVVAGTVQIIEAAKAPAPKAPPLRFGTMPPPAKKAAT